MQTSSNTINQNHEAINQQVSFVLVFPAIHVPSNVIRPIIRDIDREYSSRRDTTMETAAAHKVLGSVAG